MDSIPLDSKDEIGRMAKAIDENVKRTQEGLQKDSNLVRDVLDVVAEAKEGRFGSVIENTSLNPQINELKDAINQMSHTLLNLVGENLKNTARVFDAYKNNDFTDRIENPRGLENAVNSLGDSMVSMLSVSKNYANELEVKSKELESSVLELTESGFLEDNEKMYDHLRYLKEQGFALSMDDFGTGYSTMTMLKNQPMDEIKIDRGFIVDIENPKSQSILSHTINMLQDLDLNIIVEGVENAAQQEYLLKYGCNKAQGFLYYKPMPMEEFATLLDKA